MPEVDFWTLRTFCLSVNFQVRPLGVSTFLDFYAWISRELATLFLLGETLAESGFEPLSGSYYWDITKPEIDIASAQKFEIKGLLPNVLKTPVVCFASDPTTLAMCLSRKIMAHISVEWSPYLKPFIIKLKASASSY